MVQGWNGVLQRLRSGMGRLRRTAMQARSSASRNCTAKGSLGEMYEVGFGVAQNHEIAFMWTQIAVAMATDTMRGRIVRNPG